MILKRGQIGKIISTFPVMILIILIMGGFLVLVGFASILKGPEAVSPVVVNSASEVDGYVESKIYALIYEIAYAQSGSYSSDTVRDFIVLNMEEGMCFYLDLSEGMFGSGYTILYEKRAEDDIKDISQSDDRLKYVYSKDVRSSEVHYYLKNQNGEWTEVLYYIYYGGCL